VVFATYMQPAEPSTMVLGPAAFTITAMKTRISGRLALG